MWWVSTAPAAAAGLERGWAARLTAANGALLVCVLPVPSMVRVVCSVVLLGVLITFLVLLVRTVVRSRRARRRPAASPAAVPA
ncbi:hypothetical protein, partial [Streptomyces sp. YIM 98790]|uniref:hypothetical protein n=1 Tax=Streptomyces sp. YIM 98790 TaxID=2689077 RepID=UPI00140C254B